MSLPVVLAAAVGLGLCLVLSLVALGLATRSVRRAEQARDEAVRVSTMSVARAGSPIGSLRPEPLTVPGDSAAPSGDSPAAAQAPVPEDKMRIYRAFLQQVTEENARLMDSNYIPSVGMAEDSLTRLRVDCLLWGSAELLRTLRNFSVLRARRPRGPWHESYTMAYARLESELVSAIRQDLGLATTTLSMEQVWASISTGSTDPVFRLALITPLEEVLRNAGQDIAHYTLGSAPSQEALMRV